jgi:hypothetical protein
MSSHKEPYQIEESREERIAMWALTLTCCLLGPALAWLSYFLFSNAAYISGGLAGLAAFYITFSALEFIIWGG